MTATCDKCEPVLNEEELQEARQIYADHPAINCVGCILVNMRFVEVAQA